MSGTLNMETASVVSANSGHGRIESLQRETDKLRRDLQVRRCLRRQCAAASRAKKRASSLVWAFFFLSLLLLPPLLSCLLSLLSSSLALFPPCLP